MDIFKVVETLQSYSGDLIGYKLDNVFAEAVTEAVSLLISQGEQIADLENKLATVNGGWVPVELGFFPEEDGRYLCNVRSSLFRKSFYQMILYYDKHGFRDGHIYTDDVTHWMPLPNQPKEE